VGLTQKKLAEIIGVSQDTITNYTKDTIPRADILYKISTICGVSMEWLLTGKRNERLKEQDNIEGAKKGLRLASFVFNIMILYLIHVLDECKSCKECLNSNSPISYLLRMSDAELAKLLDEDISELKREGFLPTSSCAGIQPACLSDYQSVCPYP